MEDGVTVVTHANCNDGETSKAIIQKYLKENMESLQDVQYINGIYSIDYSEEEYLNSFKNKIVIVADFSFSPNVTREILKVCKKLIILDHHISSIRKYEEDPIKDEKFELILNQEKSGARLTWEYFYPNESVPPIVRYVEDRDLWRFQFKETKDIHFALSCLRSEEIIPHIESNNVNTIFEKGKAISLYLDFQIRNLVKNSKEENLEFNGKRYKAIIINCPPFLISDTLSNIYKNYECDFAIAYFDNKKTRLFSFRSDNSNENSFDVSKIAEALGGGGHKNAAGANIKIEDLGTSNHPIRQIQNLLDTKYDKF